MCRARAPPGRSTCVQPHEDGPAYHPGVCILSLAHPAVLRFRRKAAAGGCVRPMRRPASTAAVTKNLEGPAAPLEACIFDYPLCDGVCGRAGGGPAAQQPVLSVLLMPRSLVVFADEAYTDCLHGIDEVCVGGWGV